MEMYLAVAMVIHMFDLKLLDPVPSPVSVCVLFINSYSSHINCVYIESTSLDRKSTTRPVMLCYCQTEDNNIIILIVLLFV